MATENKYIMRQCTVADSDELTRNNIPAFWADRHWNLAWRHRTLEYHISQVAKRTPRNLLSNPETKRQQKAVDPATGRIVGFARWYLPGSHSTTADGTPTWPDAVVPAVTSEEEAEIQRVAKTAHWDPNEESDELIIPIREAKDEILAKKPYMRLDYLAVHPDNQGKGIGTLLVESGMKQAEELKLDIFVHAMKAGVGVYKRLGFYIEKEFFQDDTKYGGEGEVYTALMIYRQKV
ncbi:acetyltransferase [Colletotrichum graminicola]|uniref:Acetyltransferase n=1 Tax=Colletotrichum graminicola (strain M1.001 / M2 / FGSC 10212) TaxID=645133 RepID=E3QYU3_COLGM|nr:acetyltransferase [Colletotrichum graminicola M1.001]EFQ36031.1 acetyltransferase [Colletotrichum graminicola M1.001]WDK14719.1 acetyltransferase [Colletotrichum graminicola]